MGRGRYSTPAAVSRSLHASRGASAITRSPRARSARTRPMRKLTMFHEALIEMTIRFPWRGADPLLSIDPPGAAPAGHAARYLPVLDRQCHRLSPSPGVPARAPRWKRFRARRRAVHGVEWRWNRREAPEKSCRGREGGYQTLAAGRRQLTPKDVHASLLDLVSRLCGRR